MIFSVVHVGFIVVVQWVTLQLSEDLMRLVGKMMKNKVNSRMLSSPKRKELRPGLLHSIIFLNGYNPSDNILQFLKNQSCKICRKDAQVSFFPIYWQEYKLAQFHCYGRYLAKHLQRGLTLEEVAELDAEGFYKMHLMSGFDDLALATMVVSTSFPKITKYVSNTDHNVWATQYID